MYDNSADMKVLVKDNVACVVRGNELNVEDVEREMTKEELNRGCPLGVSRVTSHLFVCGAHALPGAVKALRPGLVVNAAPELPPPPEDYAQRFYVPLLDTPHSDIHQYMDVVADLINEVIETNEVVLVHCVAGVSRSVTLCLAYLIKYQKMSLRDAYYHMKKRRPQVRPNTGFFKQLLKFEEKLFGEATVKIVYCEAIDKEIPDVYEPDYRVMTWFRKRNPLDVVFALGEMYEGIHSARLKPRSLEIEGYTGTHIPAKDSKTLYLVHTQEEKESLASQRYGSGSKSKILTIHKAQGQPYEFVKITKRSTTCLHDSISHAVVAISRHTTGCIYYTDDAFDAIGRFIKKVAVASLECIKDVNAQPSQH